MWKGVDDIPELFVSGGVIDVGLTVENLLCKGFPDVSNDGLGSGELIESFSQLISKAFIGFVSSGEANDPEGLGHKAIQLQVIKGRNELARG